MTNPERIQKIRELLINLNLLRNADVEKREEALSLLDGIETEGAIERTITKKQALEAAERLRYNFPKKGTNGYRWSNIVIQYILEQDGENPPSCYYAEPTPVTADLAEPMNGESDNG